MYEVISVRGLPGCAQGHRVVEDRARPKAPSGMGLFGRYCQTVT